MRRHGAQVPAENSKRCGRRLCCVLSSLVSSLIRIAGVSGVCVAAAVLMVYIILAVCLSVLILLRHLPTYLRSSPNCRLKQSNQPLFLYLPALFFVNRRYATDTLYSLPLRFAPCSQGSLQCSPPPSPPPATCTYALLLVCFPTSYHTLKFFTILDLTCVHSLFFYFAYSI